MRDNYRSTIVGQRTAQHLPRIDLRPIHRPGEQLLKHNQLVASVEKHHGKDLLRTTAESAAQKSFCAGGIGDRPARHQWSAFIALCKAKYGLDR